MVALRKSEFAHSPPLSADLPARDEISSHLLIDELRLVGGLIERAVFTEDERRRTADLARRLVMSARANRAQHSGIDAFMHEYGLSSEEGVILMCLAEALLRIPDAETADKFIAEKIAGGHWERHLGHSGSLFVNASTWGLMLTGRIVKLRESQGANPMDSLKRLVARSGEPVIRQAIKQAVKLLGDQFVLGRTIKQAVTRAEAYEAKGYRFSYDMLGEAARTNGDAKRYLDRYMDALDVVGKAAGPIASVHHDALISRPGLSIKLSALHPRFEPGKEDRLAHELFPPVLTLVKAAREAGLNITIDAEEQDRLDVTLDVFGALFVHPALAHWHGLGIAVQAYGKRAVPVLRWLRRLSERMDKRIPVRLVKGAYWDTEIKLAQERGLPDYPVFTRKTHTDVSYLACMRLLLSDSKAFYPQFATHNAHTLSTAYVTSKQADYEFQRLHGMGEALYAEVIGPDKLKRPCRIYAPVGDHDELLSYLVRRLLENGANTSFVNRLADDEAPITQIIRDPVETVERERVEGISVRLLPRARELYWPERKNSAGLPLTDRNVRDKLVTEMEASLKTMIAAGPIVGGDITAGGDAATLVTCPHDRRQRMGSFRIATPAHVEAAIAAATGAAHAWDRTSAHARAKILEYTSDLFEHNRARLMAVLVREAGKTLVNAQDEVREAVDLLRYYALEARRLFSEAKPLAGPTGETNTIELRGRGPFACISPYNFPLAIFTGQIAAALAAGNPVLAKPAEQTPLTAFLAVQLFLEAGLPSDALHLLPGGPALGQALVKDPRIKGVAFTGSSETAWVIQRALSDRRSAIVPFIAETGGINAMIADSSALSEQVVRDVIRSAFDSAGQRCSAARVLYLQSDVADRMITMLKGAIEALDIGDPFDYATDIGPVIDEATQDAADAHKMKMQRIGHEIADVPVPVECRAGCYVAPAAYEISSMKVLEREIFGPVLHVIRYSRGHLDKVIAEINEAGYGLTLGLHSRIAAVADYVAEHARVGNLYINRSQVGAVPGLQPFGGEGLSGTGPKAGGPNYLIRFATERTRTTDVTATGGNVALLTLSAQSETRD
jgi:RHH-type proline utilization regulon transcriptional repressor/proline dehydrogenase/delta 1-pyrroline-5-carboxylate dehydrogenase